MRQAGTLSNQQDADRFAAYLTTLGIRARVDPAGNEWALWIYEENELPRSRQELQEFLQNLQDPRYAGAEQRAAEILRETAQREKRAAANLVAMRDRWNRPTAQACPITILLIVISVAVGLFTNFGESPNKSYFMITSLDQEQRSYQAGLPDIRSGQIWRAVTPIFLHFGMLHLVFNMYMLLVLGGMIERSRGSLRFGLLVLATAVASNLAQYWQTGPLFGGMSGVVYALFGYAWMKSLFDRSQGIFLSPTTVFIMLAWFLLCLTGNVGHVANTVHAVGLGIGIAVGYLPILWAR